MVQTAVIHWVGALYAQANLGHYGVFSGRCWQSQMYPLERDVIHVSR